MILKINHIIVIFFCLLFSFKTNAQELVNPIEAIKKKKELIYGIDNRRTHIKQQSTLIYGGYIGVGFDDKVRIKLGISSTPFERGLLVDDLGVIKRNRLIFMNLGEEYDFLIIQKFRMTTYLQTGIGFNYFRKINKYQVVVEDGRELIIPIELGLNLNYDILPWLRLKTGGGWRFVFPEYSQGLSGYYIKIGASLKTKLFLEFYRERRESRKK